MRQVLLVLATLATSVTVAEIPRRAQLTALPSVVSGTFQPPVVSLDGRRIERALPPITGLLVNDTPVTTQSGANSPFYLSTQADRLAIVALAADGSRIELVAATLPSIASVAIQGGRVQFRCGPEVRFIDIDGRRYPAVRGAFAWDPPREPADSVSVHVVEMRAASGEVARVYNLEIERQRPDSELPLPFSLGLQIHGVGQSRRLTVGALVGYRLGSYTSTLYGTYRRPSGFDEGVSATLGARVGYEFLRESKPDGATWFEAGLWGAWLKSPDNAVGAFRADPPPIPFRASFGGYQLGAYLRTEPIHWQGFGLAARIDVVAVGSFNAGGILPAVEVLWRWR